MHFTSLNAPKVKAGVGNKKMKTRILIWTGVAVLAIAVIAASLIPSYMRARNTSSSHACINNLRQVDAGKEQAVYHHGWEPSRECDVETNRLVVNQYIKGNRTPVCPAGGSYDYTTIGTDPACNVPGHSLR